MLKAMEFRLGKRVCKVRRYVDVKERSLVKLEIRGFPTGDLRQKGEIQLEAEQIHEFIKSLQMFAGKA